jgi:hypothetical protein
MSDNAGLVFLGGAIVGGAVVFLTQTPRGRHLSRRGYENLTQQFSWDNKNNAREAEFEEIKQEETDNE